MMAALLYYLFAGFLPITYLLGLHCLFLLALNFIPSFQWWGEAGFVYYILLFFDILLVKRLSGIVLIFVPLLRNLFGALFLCAVTGNSWGWVEFLACFGWGLFWEMIAIWPLGKFSFRLFASAKAELKA